MEIEEKETLQQELVDALSARNSKKLKEIFEQVPNIDIAEALDKVEDVKYLLYLFRVVSNEYAAEIFTELSSEQQEKIINAFYFFIRI